jgi:hypothetical protein
MAAELKMFLDNQEASVEQLDRFRLVKIDQAIGMVTEAEIELELRLDASGQWLDFGEAFTEPFARMRVEVKADPAGGFVALIDGPVIGQKVELSASPNQSKLTLLVHDDSVKLNQVETVAVFEERTASDIAAQLFADFGLSAEVDEVEAAGGTLERVVVQRGTPMQLLRELARQHGMLVYVKPGTRPGTSIGVFRRPDLDEGELPELVVLGEQRNLDQLHIEFDGLRPFAAAASQVDFADQSVLRAQADASSQITLGDEASHDLVESARVLLARTRETDNDLAAAVAAAVDAASWAYHASGEVDSAAYPAVLQPYGTVSVAGAGPMSGLYLVSQVTHLIDDQSYRQQFALRRNARSAPAGGGGPLGSVF